MACASREDMECAPPWRWVYPIGIADDESHIVTTRSQPRGYFCQRFLGPAASQTAGEERESHWPSALHTACQTLSTEISAMLATTGQSGPARGWSIACK